MCNHADPPTFLTALLEYKVNRGQQSVTVNDGGAIKVYGGRIANNSKVELEASKNVRLLLDDPCSKVIPVALRKYNVADDWQNYALCIQWGPEDNLQGSYYGISSIQSVYIPQLTYYLFLRPL
jgi:hypothetical protein